MSEPIIKMDADGQASIISYNVPEPTSYSGRNIIELDFGDSVFSDAAMQIPENRQKPVTAKDLEAALDSAASTGVVDATVLPNASPRTMRRPARGTTLDRSER